MKHVVSLRSRFRSDNNVEAEWLKAASDLMSEASCSKDKAEEPAPHGGQDSPSGQKRGNDDAANVGANKRKRASQEDDQHMPGSEGGQTSDGARVENDVDLPRCFFHPMPNLGNTCYLNAAVQVLRAMQPCMSFLDDHVRIHDAVALLCSALFCSSLSCLFCSAHTHTRAHAHKRRATDNRK